MSRGRMGFRQGLIKWFKQCDQDLASVCILPLLFFGDGFTPRRISQDVVTRCLPAMSGTTFFQV